VVVTGSHVTNKVPSCGPDSTCTSEGGSGSPKNNIVDQHIIKHPLKSNVKYKENLKKKMLLKRNRMKKIFF